VPGFTQAVHLFDTAHKIERFAVFNPNLVSQCFFLSYQDQLCFSLTTDKATVAQPALLVQSFAAEVREWATSLASCAHG
jgi:hypothetical protein